MSDEDIDAKGEFQCRRCGRCCQWPGYVRVSGEEINAIAEFLGMSEREFIETYTIITDDRRGLSILEKANGHCVFYHDDPPRCQIDPVKPKQCRDFPGVWNFPGWNRICEGGRRSIDT